MKKQILLVAALCSVSFVTVNAQMQYNKKDANVGFIGQDTLDNGNFRMIHTFNLSDDWKASKKPVTEKLSSSNGKGIYGMGITTEGVNNNIGEWINNGKTQNSGQNISAIWVPSAQVLRDSLSKDADALKHEYWKQGCALWDVPGTDGADQAFTTWTGMAKRSIIGFQVKAQDLMAGLVSDIEFEMLTLDPGNTGKTSTYKMIVDLAKQPAFPWLNATYGGAGEDIALLDSISEANVDAINAEFGSQMYVKDAVYVSSEDGNLNRVKINVAEAVGLSINDLRGKKVMVTLYSTTSETAVQPGMYEPIVGVDNVTTEYATASWIEPVVANNETIEKEVTAYYGEETPITFNLKGKNRFSTLSIKSDGDNKASTSFYFKEEGCVMAKDAEGNYTVPVAYTFTPSVDEGATSIVVDGGEDGNAIDDDVQVTLYTKFSAGKRLYQLEISNGARFWMKITANGEEKPTSLSTESIDTIEVTTADGQIFVANATESVSIYNEGGQLLRTVSADAASRGIAAGEGFRLVRVGEVVEKVLVK